jgi:hypothetical protein
MFSRDVLDARVAAANANARVFQRSHPMTAAIGAAYGWNDAQIDAFFRTAAAL